MCRHEWHEFMPGTDYCIKCNLRRPTPDQPAAPAWERHESANHDPAAPDEDADAVNVTAIDYIVRQHYPSALAIAQALHTAGYRRPVDTRPTRSRLLWLGLHDICADTLIYHKLAVEDPAPAAEVPVVEVRREDVEGALRVIASIGPDQNYECVHNLAAALTRAES